MSTAPLWQAGHQYVPGDLVQPVQAPAASLASLTNPGFESGSSSWSLPTGATIETDHAYAGSNRCKFTGSAGDIRLVNTTLVACTPGTTISASAMYQQGGADAGDNVGTICLVWYDAGSAELSESLGVAVSSGSNDEWHASTISATAPASTAYVAIGFHVNRTDSSESSSVDAFSWNLVSGGTSGGLIYRAVQADPGFSGETEPAWPSTVGVTVVDNEVTWEAVQASRVTWEAHPICVSGGSEPTWPTTPGAKVINGSVAFECISRRVEDEKCPNSRVVAIMSSKVFAADGDVVRYCATANPLDWQAENDAGYLPTGLQQANANEIAVLAPYRSNLAAMNPDCFQAWQIDPDPALMSLLDQMDGVGSGHQLAAQAVANDLFYLSQRGVRSVAISVGAENLAAGDVGTPVDELIQAALAVAAANNLYALGTYYPGAGQYWLTFPNYPSPTFTISGDVPDGVVDGVVEASYTGSGGLMPYGSFTVTSGSLPPGLTLATDGTVSGTLTTAGNYSWVVSCTDAEGSTDTVADTCAVTAPPGTFFSAGALQSKTSPTGATWTNKTTTPLQNCTAVSGLIAAHDDSGAFKYSTDDGATMVAAASTFSGAGRMASNGVDRIRCLRSVVGPTLKVLESTDSGNTYTEIADLGSRFGNEIKFGLGKWVIATSDGLYVADGTSGTYTRVMGGDWTALGFNGVGFLIGSNTGGTFKYCTGDPAVDGNWVTMGASMAPYAPLSICGAPGFFVIGTLEFGIHRTTDNGASLTKVVDDGGRFYSAQCIGAHVVVGSGGSDGNQYQSQNSGVSFVLISPAIADMDICVVPP